MSRTRSGRDRRTGRSRPGFTCLLRLGQGGLDRLDDRAGLGSVLGAESGNDLALAVDQELGEVPGDLAGELGVRLLAREILEQGVDPFALDDDLREERERDLIG